MATRKYVERDGKIFCDRRNCPGSEGLRCQRTNVPICSQCAVRTPVGYISKDAAKQQADRFFNIGMPDYVIAGGIAFFATLISGFIVSMFLGSIWLILFFIGAPVGGAIGDTAWRAIRYRRGRYTSRVVGGAMLLATFMLFPFGGISALIFGGIATVTAVSRFEVAIRR